MASLFLRVDDFLKRFFRFDAVNIVFFLLITFFTIVLPAAAESDCITSSPPAEWKSHFPFDLIYPIGKEYTSPDACPKITFWGSEREVCSVKTITGIVKNVFLFKIVIQSLFTL